MCDGALNRTLETTTNTIVYVTGGASQGTAEDDSGMRWRRFKSGLKREAPRFGPCRAERLSHHSAAPCILARCTPWASPRTTAGKEV